MTTLSQRLDDYLAVRRGLGYDLSFAERVLRRFTEFADGKGADHITVELFLRWKDAFGAADNNTWSTRLSMVRVFARWLLAHDERTEVPPRAYAGRQAASGATLHLHGRRYLQDRCGCREAAIPLRSARLDLLNALRTYCHQRAAHQ